MWTILGSLAIVAIVGLAGWYADRRFGILPRGDRARADGRVPRATASPPTTFAAGEAPATAITVTASALARLRAAPPPCLADGTITTPAPDDSVRLGDRVITVLRFTCPRCAAPRSIFACQTDRVDRR